MSGGRRNVLGTSERRLRHHHHDIGRESRVRFESTMAELRSGLRVGETEGGNARLLYKFRDVTTITYNMARTADFEDVRIQRSPS